MIEENQNGEIEDIPIQDELLEEVLITENFQQDVDWLAIQEELIKSNENMEKIISILEPITNSVVSYTVIWIPLIVITLFFWFIMKQFLR